MPEIVLGISLGCHPETETSRSCRQVGDHGDLSQTLWRTCPGRHRRELCVKLEGKVVVLGADDMDLGLNGSERFRRFTVDEGGEGKDGLCIWGWPATGLYSGSAQRTPVRVKAIRPVRSLYALGRP